MQIKRRQVGARFMQIIIAISTVLSLKYFVLWIFRVKKIQYHKRMFSLGYLCFQTMRRA